MATLIDEVKEVSKLVKSFDKRLAALEALVGTGAPKDDSPLEVNARAMKRVVKRSLQKPRYKRPYNRATGARIDEGRALIHKQLESAGNKGVPATALQAITGLSKTTMWKTLAEAKTSGHVYNKDWRWFLVPKSLREAQDTRVSA